MSEKEKEIVEKIASLPPQLQDKFLDRVEGAVMALDAMSAEKEEEDGA